MTAQRDQFLVDGFVRRYLSFRGSLRLHRHALGLDLLRAPANTLLSPVFLLTRLLSFVFHSAGFHGVARALRRPRFQFPLATGRALEDALSRDVLDPGRPTAPSKLRRLLVQDYLAARTAVAEIFTTVFVVVAGLLAFRAMTPGILSLAPLLSDHAAQAQAVEAFPLGRRLGGVWYDTFPAAYSLWDVVGTGLLLLLAASLVTTFVGVLADPIQSALGFHQRRVLRLLSSLDAAEDGRPRLPREHLVARLGDLLDAGVSMIRLFRP